MLDAREIVVKASEDRLRESHAEFERYQDSVKRQLQQQLEHLKEIEALQARRPSPMAGSAVMSPLAVAALAVRACAVDCL